MGLPVDQPAPVRPGEEIDLAALGAYLAEQLPGATGEVAVEQFPSGYSNLTYAVRVGTAEGARELVLRRPPFGAAVATAHDMEREHRVLSALAGVYPKAPRPVLYCDRPEVLGAPFFLMERVEGVVLRARLPEEGAIGPAGFAALSRAFADALAELHSLDYRAAGLGDLGRPEGYALRQVRGWTARYMAAKTDEVPEIERAARWLDDRLPEMSAAAPRAALVHNDFKYDNLVLDPGDLARIRAVLDWEMATVGDPWMDLGSTLAYWIEPDDPPELLSPAVPHLTALPGNLGRSELVARYSAATGAEVTHPVFVYVYGQLKLAGIVQQIYARYRSGATADPRFAGLLALVRACGRAALLAIEKGRIDRLGA